MAGVTWNELTTLQSASLELMTIDLGSSWGWEETKGIEHFLSLCPLYLTAKWYFITLKEASHRVNDFTTFWQLKKIAVMIVGSYVSPSTLHLLHVIYEVCMEGSPTEYAPVCLPLFKWSLSAYSAWKIYQI